MCYYGGLGNCVTARFDNSKIVDILQKTLMKSEMLAAINNNYQWVDSSKHRNDAENLMLLNNVQTFIQ